MANTYRVIIVVSIMLATSLTLAYFNQSEDIEINKSLSGFPLQIGDWQGKSYQFEQWVNEKTGVDDSFVGRYFIGSGQYIELYIGYYENQREGDTIHSPKNCMPGSGWNIIESSIVEVRMPSAKKSSIKVAKLILQNGSKREMMLYWYHSRGRIIASEYYHKFFLVFDSLSKHRTDGSFIRLISPISKNEQETLALLKRFISLLFPIIQEYIPS